MAEQQPRSTFPENETWDLTALFPDQAAFEQAIADTTKDVEAFVAKFNGHLDTLADFTAAYEAYETLMIKVTRIMIYSYIPQSSDYSDAAFAQNAAEGNQFATTTTVALSFFDDAVINAPTEITDELAKIPGLSKEMRQIARRKQHYLGADVEKTLANLSEIMQAPSDIYSQMRAGDFAMDDFEVDGTTYQNSFVMYENFYQNHESAAVREAAFRSFSAGLRAHENAAATAYLNQVRQEKTLADMRGYANVFDYLLDGQEVTHEMFDRQIDLIMNDFGPVAQRYLKHVAQVNHLDQLTFADWKLDLDVELNPAVSIDEAYDLVMSATAPLSSEYTDQVKNYQTERWVDFAANKGKESGGYATTPYRVHPYILMSWTGRLSDVYTLIHEIGHAGQFIFSEMDNSLTDSDMSTYYVEAPSTFNELLLSDYLENQAEDPRTKRFALAHRLTDTYFHNFITHLLEAAFQREVYNLIEAGQTFGADKLNGIMKDVLQKFWGDAVVIDDDAALTWMRQSHYYMGLYSYTYSAGLVVSTQGFINLKANPVEATKNWLDFLKSGGSLAPLETIKITGADVSTDAPLRNTIDFLSDTVEQIIAYTAQIENK
ncbi:MAG: oligoendopeptidase F [Lactobacillaceae bacterium]|jgi:oligoendopeptidase F|nr:oligoendopeptidase F [Lactobacillaceae bacterium]